MSEKIYVPQCYARERTGMYGSFLSLQFDAAILIEFIKANANTKGFFNLTVSPRKEKSGTGLTHSVFLDTFVPKEKGTPKPAPPAPQASAPPHPPFDDENPPF